MSPAEQQNLAVVRRLWRQSQDNPGAASHPFFEVAHEDVEMTLYQAGGRTLRGRGALAAFEAASPNLSVTAKAHRMESHGDDVVVHGWVRVRRNGGYAESQLSWTYTFRDGRVARLTVNHA